MSLPGNWRENWLRPFLFYGNNPLSLLGGALTTAAALVLIGFSVVDIFGHGGSKNPYIGIIVDLCLPALFVLGLILIPIGIVFSRTRLKAAGQIPSVFPQVSFGDPIFRRGIFTVAAATFINFVVVGTASYRGVAYMDTANFCGQSCHVMAPEWSAYQVSPHSGVACSECHIAPGIPGFVHAKTNGTKQLLMVIFNKSPRPVMAENKIPSARVTCLNCHNPDRYIGDKLVVKPSYGDDEKNSVTRTLVLVHVGGRDSLSHLSGIHGAHLGHIEYISTDAERQVIPWVSRRNGDGSTTEFASGDATGPVKGTTRVMDCIDCHNRAAHTFQTPEDALNRAMAEGSISPALPFVHQQGLALLKASYPSQAAAETRIKADLEGYYRSQHPATLSSHADLIHQAAVSLFSIYRQNIFPDMKVKWGTHPNNVGHNSYPGCFRCHDGNHNSKDGKAITQDCAACHNLLAVDEANPKLLADMGMQ